MPLSIFRIRNVSGGNLVMLLLVGASIGIGFFASLYVQNVLHYSPAVSGLSFLPIPIIIGVVSTYAPRLIGRFGFKTLLIFGMGLIALGFFLLSRLEADSAYFTRILPAFVLMAFGDGLAFVAGTVAATTGVRGEESGLASGLVNTAQQVGGALGLAVLSAVASAVTSTSLAAGQSQVQANLQGYQQAFFYAAMMLILALILTALILRMPKVVEEEQSGCLDSNSLELDC